MVSVSLPYFIPYSKAKFACYTNEQWLLQCRKVQRSYSMFKVRRGGSEEIPLVQSKEQWLWFAGAAVKRYPTSKVRQT